MDRLAEKVAVVVGEGSLTDGIGNGRATCLLYAREDPKTAVLDPNDDAAQQTVPMITEEGGSAMPVTVDVTVEKSGKSEVHAVLEAWGKVNVLINVVGFTEPLDTAVAIFVESVIDRCIVVRQTGDGEHAVYPADLMLKLFSLRQP